jgi:hypothetical protein
MSVRDNALLKRPSTTWPLSWHLGSGVAVGVADGLCEGSGVKVGGVVGSALRVDVGATAVLVLVDSGLVVGSRVVVRLFWAVSVSSLVLAQAANKKRIQVSANPRARGAKVSENPLDRLVLLVGKIARGLRQ